MSDEGTLREQASRGDRARRIFEQDIVQEAFSVIEKTILDAWRMSKADEQQERDNAYLAQRLLMNLKQQFVIAMATGQASQKELLRIKDQSKIRRLLTNVRRT